MSINFNLGEHFHNDSSGFLIKLIISILGAFFGFLFALLLNKLLDRNKRNKEFLIKERQHFSQLKYLSLFLESIVDTSINQFREIEAHSVIIKTAPLKISEPVWFASNDLVRLQNMSSDELFQSYLHFFSATDSEIKTYKNIFSNIDYLNRIFQDFEKRNTKHQDYLSTYLKLVIDCMENIILRIAKFENNLILTNQNEYTNFPEYVYLQSFKKIYLEYVNKVADFEELKTRFFIPLQQTIFENIKDLAFIDEVIPFIRKGTNALMTSEANSINYADICVEDKENVLKAIEYINAICIKIKHLNSP